MDRHEKLIQYNQVIAISVNSKHPLFQTKYYSSALSLAFFK